MQQNNYLHVNPGGHCLRCHEDFDKDIMTHIGHACTSKDKNATGCPITCKDKRFYMPKLLFSNPPGPKQIQNYHDGKEEEGTATFI